MLKDNQKFINITKIVKQHKLYPMYRTILQVMYKRVDESREKTIYLNGIFKEFYYMVQKNEINKLIKLLNTTKKNYIVNHKERITNFSKLYFYQRNIHK